MTFNLIYSRIWFSVICWSILLVSGSFAQQIYLDDDFRDWNAIPALHTDKSGDGGVSGIDFRVLKMSNSDEYLYLYLEVSKFINIQSSNSITIYIDADNQSGTGLNIYGIGADLTFNFGSRGGFYYSGSSTLSTRHAAIGLVTSPTVTSDRFEIAIRRKFNVSGTETFLQDRIKIVFSNETVAGDRLPDTNGGIEYLFSDNGPDLTLPYSIDKKDTRHVRLMAYNVERDNFFNLAVRDQYRRIFNAIQPDIIGFSEIYNNSSSVTAALVENLLPSADGRQWYHAGVSPDIRLVSRYPIIDTREIDGNGAFLLNMGAWQLVCIITHLPCCENETARQQEVDKIMAFVRDIRLGLSPFDVRQGTPVIIAGDMNFVGFREQLQTMLTGDIANNSFFGPDFRPDWDESDLDDLTPFVTDAPFTYTWYNPAGSFSAGRLDYIIYTGSVLDIHNSFTLNTEVMQAEKRSAFGLLSGDTGPVSDHFPLVADFSLKGSVSGNTNVIPSDKDSIFWSVYPNPSVNRMVKVVLQNTPLYPPELHILTPDGKSVQKFSFAEGSAELNINGENLTPGLYYFQLKAGNEVYRKAVYLN